MLLQEINDIKILGFKNYIKDGFNYFDLIGLSF